MPSSASTLPFSLRCILVIAVLGPLAVVGITVGVQWRSHQRLVRLARAAAERAPEVADKEVKAPGITVETCLACHGPNAAGDEDKKAPRLAGQDPVYLQQQITSFRDGMRGHHADDAAGQQMAAIAAGLKDELLVEQLSATLANMSIDSPGSRWFGDRRRGRELYRQNCAVCHGDQGEGDLRYHMPRLNHQHGWYLQEQLTHFREGLRGTADKDESGKAMAFYAKLLPDDRAVKDVVSYLTHLSRSLHRKTERQNSATQSIPPASK